MTAAGPIDSGFPLQTIQPLVLVLAGTDYHPFNRLIEWTDEWLGIQPGSAVRMITQHGSTHAPSAAEGRDFMPRQELDSLLGQATVVVCHGGPSTIVETRRQGLVPIVLARSGRLGEHVDDHQQRFARLMHDRGLIRLVETRDELRDTLDQATRRPLLVSESDRMANPAESALRLGKLVDELVYRHRRPTMISQLRRRLGPVAHRPS